MSTKIIEHDIYKTFKVLPLLYEVRVLPHHTRCSSTNLEEDTAWRPDIRASSLASPARPGVRPARPGVRMGSHQVVPRTCTCWASCWVGPAAFDSSDKENKH